MDRGSKTKLVGGRSITWTCERRTESGVQNSARGHSVLLLADQSEYYSEYIDTGLLLRPMESEEISCVWLFAHTHHVFGAYTCVHVCMRPRKKMSEREWERASVYVCWRTEVSCCEIQAEVISKALVAACNTQNMLSRTLLRRVCEHVWVFGWCARQFWVVDVHMEDLFAKWQHPQWSSYLRVNYTCTTIRHWTSLCKCLLNNIFKLVVCYEIFTTLPAFLHLHNCKCVTKSIFNTSTGILWWEFMAWELLFDSIQAKLENTLY